MIIKNGHIISYPYVHDPWQCDYLSHQQYLLYPPLKSKLDLEIFLISGHYQIWCSRDIGSICALGLTLLLNTLRWPCTQIGFTRGWNKLEQKEETPLGQPVYS